MAQEIQLRPDNIDEVLSELTLKEKASLVVGASYNRLNGVHTQEDKWLLTDVLRDEWGHRGLVMTDWTEREKPSRLPSRTRERLRERKSSSLRIPDAGDQEIATTKNG